MECRVCVAIDHSATSQQALKWAATLVQRGDEMRLFTVVPPSADSEAAQGVHATDLGTLIPPTEADPGELKQSRAFLADSTSEAVAQGLKPTQIVAEPVVASTGVGDSRDIGRAINAHTDACGCDLLVMASRELAAHKRSLLGLFGVGSVSDYVLRHGAGTNVVIYKDKKLLAEASQEAEREGQSRGGQAAAECRGEASAAAGARAMQRES